MGQTGLRSHIARLFPLLQPGRAASPLRRRRHDEHGVLLAHQHLRALILHLFMPWLGAYRPMAGVYYLPLLHMFGLNPFPFQIVLLALLAGNLYFFSFSRRASAPPNPGCAGHPGDGVSRGDPTSNTTVQRHAT